MYITTYVLVSRSVMVEYRWSFRAQLNLKSCRTLSPWAWHRLCLSTLGTMILGTDSRCAHGCVWKLPFAHDQSFPRTADGRDSEYLRRLPIPTPKGIEQWIDHVHNFILTYPGFCATLLMWSKFRSSSCIMSSTSSQEPSSTAYWTFWVSGVRASDAMKIPGLRITNPVITEGMFHPIASFRRINRTALSRPMIWKSIGWLVRVAQAIGGSL